MSISTRRKFGILLVAISVAALVAFFIVGIFCVRGTGDYVAGGSIGNTHWAVYSGSGKSEVSGYYLIPAFLSGAIGVICLAWPSRKPPKLHA
jgi:hypothetical protein